MVESAPDSRPSIQPQVCSLKLWSTNLKMLTAKMMMRFALYIFFLILPLAVKAGNFFPPEYKQFPFKEGDLLVSKARDGKYSVNKILKVDRFDLKTGASINIQGKTFTATEDDYLLVVSAAFGEAEFRSFEVARAAAHAGKWKVKLQHAPNRTPGAAEGQTYVGHQRVDETEMTGYRQWRRAFDKGEAGIF